MNTAELVDQIYTRWLELAEAVEADDSKQVKAIAFEISRLAKELTEWFN